MDHQRVNMLLTRWYSEDQPTLFAKSETEILELTSAIHAPGDNQTSVDVDFIFRNGKTAVSDATDTFDSVVKGCEFGTHFTPYWTSGFQDRPVLARWMGQGGRGDIRTNLEPYTIHILKVLSIYSWEAKAVMALSTFAQKYSFMCSNLYPILKQVPDSTNPTVVLNRQGRIVILNNLVKANLQLIDHTLKLKKVRKDIPSLDSAVKHIPVYVFWSIITMMACVTESIRLTSFDEDNCYDLNQFFEKINSIIKNLEIVQKELAEKSGAKYVNPRKPKQYRVLIDVASDSGKKFFDLIFHDNYHINIVSHGVKLTENKEPLYIDIEKKLSQRYLFLFLTTMQICESDIAHLKNLQADKTKAKMNKTVFNPYKILWIPVIREKWTTEVEMMYNNWKSKMHWYCVFYFSAHKKSIKKLEDLGFDYNKSMLIVIDPLGKVVDDKKALQKLRDNKGSMRAFPYLLRKT